MRFLSHLKTKQPRFPYLLLITLLYTLHQLHCPSLSTSQLSTLLEVSAPAQNREKAQPSAAWAASREPEAATPAAAQLVALRHRPERRAGSEAAHPPGGAVRGGRRRGARSRARARWPRRWRAAAAEPISRETGRLAPLCRRDNGGGQRRVTSCVRFPKRSPSVANGTQTAIVPGTL